MSLLPENKRRTVDRIDKKVMWIYGAPYSGKTFLANSFPNPVMLNTDGNVKFVDAPYVAIKDTMEGRVKKTAWENFKAVIDELEMNQNTFETIVIDLLEDVLAHDRREILRNGKFTHETDMGGYGKGYQIIADDFLPVIEKVRNLNYPNIIFLSHAKWEEVTSPSGETYSKVSPNIRPSLALKISGMVDFTGHLTCEGDVRTISIKQTKAQFGGGRPEFYGKTFPATYEAICDLYNMKPMEEVVSEPVAEIPAVETVEVQTEQVEEEVPKRRKLKRKDDGE